MLCRNVSIFYLQNLSSIFQVQEKLKACRNLKLIFSSSCFNVNDSHVKIVWLHEEYAEFNWWCSLFLFLIGNTLFEYIWSQNLKLFVLSCSHTNSNIKNLVVIFILEWLFSELSSAKISLWDTIQIYCIEDLVVQNCDHFV